jgi:V8-like Glu-specific endopeptidase
MRKPRKGALLGTLLGALLATAAVTAPSAPAAPSAIDFSGTVALNNCSGSLVKLAGAATSGAALVLTNGHCYEGGFLNPGQVLVNKSSTRSFTLLSPTGGNKATLRATKVAYATMTDTDMTLYQLNTTYDAIKTSYGISPLEISATHPTAGTAIKVVSGYWKKIYSCNIDGFVYRLKESNWTWKDSIRYTSTCDTIGGTSGSPIEDPSGKLIGINNTGNESGERCTLDNPCEVDQSGNVTVHEGTNYGEETYLLAGCMTGSTVNLNLAGCALPKP